MLIQSGCVVELVLAVFGSCKADADQLVIVLCGQCEVDSRFAFASLAAVLDLIKLGRISSSQSNHLISLGNLKVPKLLVRTDSKDRQSEDTDHP